jgi:transposase InsO family protein
LGFVETNSVPSDVRWAIATWPDDVARGAVAAFCAEHRISRSVFYKIRALARERGAGAVIAPGSRAPVRSPGRVDRAAVEQALAMRADLARRGLDHGPLSVIDQLRRAGLNPPSRATLARYFRAEGVVVPEPRKRPRAANRRFAAPAPNCMWQIDAFDWSLADGSPATVFQVIDDHSRRLLASLTARGETSAAAIEVVGLAIDRFGVPLRLLSDNGAAFNPTRRGHTGALVELLRSLGVDPVTGKPGKPTTQGKNERVHKPTIAFLNAQPPARTLAELQAQIDLFDEHYNHHRGHQSLGMATPVEAWNKTPVADPPPLPVRTPCPAALSCQARTTGPDRDSPLARDNDREDRRARTSARHRVPRRQTPRRHRSDHQLHGHHRHDHDARRTRATPLRTPRRRDPTRRPTHPPRGTVSPTVHDVLRHPTVHDVLRQNCPRCPETSHPAGRPTSAK